MEMHGWTIDAYSAGLGHGSAFTIRLPVLTWGLVETARDVDRLEARPCVGRRVLVRLTRPTR